MKRKIEYPSRTIDDDIVRKGISAISVFNHFPDRKDVYVVVGGVATQSYLPSTCRRPTADIDIALGKPLPTEKEFRDFVKPVVEQLKDNGFLIDYIGKGRSNRSWTLSTSIPKSPGKEEIILGFTKDNSKSFKPKQERRERKIRNGRLKTIEERGEVYRVASPEDIIFPKFVRLGKILTEFPEFSDLLDPYQHEITDGLIRSTMNTIADQRARLLVGYNRKEDSKNRVICDSYDIRILYELPGINEDYFRESVRFWPMSSVDDNVKRKLPPLMPGLEELLINKPTPVPT